MKLLLFITTLTMSLSASALTFSPDVPAPVKQQVINDLSFIKTISSANKATPFHKQIFGTVNGLGYLRFFETRIQKVGMGCGDGMAVACVKPYVASNIMWLTENYIKFSHPAIARMMVVFHEARHGEAQNGNWHHATCPTPFLGPDRKEVKSIWTGSVLAGEPACDITPFGSYGSSTIMLANISKYCTNCNSKVRMDAKIYANDQLKRLSNKAAYDKTLVDLNTP